MSGGAPLKPWEVARQGQSPVSTATFPSIPSRDEQDERGQEKTQTAQTTPAYSLYSRPNYMSPYQPNYSSYASGSPYGSGYLSSYGTGLYGSSYGASYGGQYGGPSYGTGYGMSYGGMYGYGRQPPWTQQPQIPGAIGMNNDHIPKMPMWQRFLDFLHKIVNCFGRVSFLIDENTHAFHFLLSALLAFLDKAGSLYGELMRYVLKLLGVGRRRSRKGIGHSDTNGGRK